MILREQRKAGTEESQSNHSAAVKESPDSSSRGVCNNMPLTSAETKLRPLTLPFPGGWGRGGGRMRLTLLTSVNWGLDSVDLCPNSLQNSLCISPLRICTWLQTSPILLCRETLLEERSSVFSLVVASSNKSFSCSSAWLWLLA